MDKIVGFVCMYAARFRLQRCRQDIHVRKGTWLEGSKVSFSQIVLFFYYWSKELTSIRFCEEEFEFCKEAVIDWNMYLHEVCADTLLNNPVITGGLNRTVEIDESLFTRGTSNEGRLMPHQWVFGGICRYWRMLYVPR